MISRVAECCFWLGRYWERADATTRLVAVNRLAVLDAEIEGAERWQPAIVVAGERERFEKEHKLAGYARDAIATRFLTWDEKNPSSIYSCFRAARENARTTREVISREMWEVVNFTWQWLNSPEGERAYRRDAAEFLQRLRAVYAELHGVAQSTMLHGEPYDFLRMGVELERAEQTARLLDAHYYRIGVQDVTRLDSPLDAAQWMQQLRLSAAVEPFFKVNRREPAAESVCRFLLQHEQFPRSVRFAFERVKRRLGTVLEALERCPDQAEVALGLVQEGIDQVTGMKVDQVVRSGSLHADLTELVVLCGKASLAIQRGFFVAESP